MGKNFAWSWTRLKNFRACPKRSWHVDINRDVKEPESDELRWGNRLHDAYAKHIDRGVPIPGDLVHVDSWPALVRQLKMTGTYDIKVEAELAVDRNFRKTGWFDADTWLRAKIDVLMLGAHEASVIDWKTGKIKPEAEQLAINAQVIFAHYPEVQEISSAYRWVGKDDSSEGKHERAGMVPIWNALLPEIRVMEEAHRTTTYPPLPGKLCRAWCPVKSCPYNGQSFG